MSSIIATVKEIENCDSLNLVYFKFFNQILSMMSLDLDKDIKIGTSVRLTLKATNIIIVKNHLDDISCSNQISATISSIENGKLLSYINLDSFGSSIDAIITLKSSLKLKLKAGDSIIALINESDISISKILDKNN